MVTAPRQTRQAEISLAILVAGAKGAGSTGIIPAAYLVLCTEGRKMLVPFTPIIVYYEGKGVHVRVPCDECQEPLYKDVPLNSDFGSLEQSVARAFSRILPDKIASHHALYGLAGPAHSIEAIHAYAFSVPEGLASAIMLACYAQGTEEAACAARGLLVDILLPNAGIIEAALRKY